MPVRQEVHDLIALRVDQLGYLPFEPNAAHPFFQLVSRCYERGAMLVNVEPGGWGAVSGDAVVASAIPLPPAER